MKRRNGMLLALLVITGTFTSVVAPPARAQQSREEIIRAALEEFDVDRAFDGLRAGVDPNLGLPDSLWAVGVMRLAEILWERDQTEEAATWLRWAVRLWPDMPVDSVTLLYDVVAAHGRAKQLVGSASAADSATHTSWDWDAPVTIGRRGQLLLGGGQVPVDVQVEVVGLGRLLPGQTRALRPGSYDITASQQGYDTVQVTREILPGVATVLRFELSPTVVAIEPQAVPLAPAVNELPEDVESAVLARLARFHVIRFRTEPSCGTGFLVGDGLLLTTYTAVRGAERVDVRLADGRSVAGDVTVAAWDSDQNVAVLGLPTSPQDSLLPAREVAPDDWVWGVRHEECETPTLTRSRIVAWQDQPEGLLALADTVPDSQQGGPLVDRSGAVVGLLAAPVAAVPVDHTTALLDRARRNLESQELLSLREVAQRENHLYGSVLIQSSFPTATAEVVPLEDWHWAAAGASGAIPLAFTGPMGRYRLDITASGQPPHRAEFQVDPGLFKQITEPQVIARRGGKFPWPLALIGFAAAGGAAALFLGGGDEEPPSDRRGDVVITVPVNPNP